jgi:hypothetical protein
MVVMDRNKLCCGRGSNMGYALLPWSFFICIYLCPYPVNRWDILIVGSTRYNVMGWGCKPVWSRCQTCKYVSHAVLAPWYYLLTELWAKIRDPFAYIFSETCP